MVKDKAAVDSTIRKLYLQLIPAMDKELRKVRVTQTPLAEDCLVSRLRGDPPASAGEGSAAAARRRHRRRRVEVGKLDDATQKIYMCYVFLATLQELIIQHLDSTILES